MILTVMKKYFRELQPRIINYRSYNKDFSNEFLKDLKRKIAIQVFPNNDNSIQRFCDINIEILNEY